MIIGWIVIYLIAAALFVRRWSACCCLTYTEYEYTPVSILSGLFFPITILIHIILFIIETEEGNKDDELV